MWMVALTLARLTVQEGVNLSSFGLAAFSPNDVFNQLPEVRSLPLAVLLTLSTELQAVGKSSEDQPHPS